CALLGLATLAVAQPPHTWAAPPVATEAAARPASIHLWVPAAAEIWFEGDKTTQTGSFRRFVSPPLRPGYSYVYRVPVRWTGAGRPIEVTRDVSVTPGNQVELNFTALSAVEARAYYFAPDAPTPAVPAPARPSSFRPISSQVLPTAPSVLSFSQMG